MVSKNAFFLYLVLGTISAYFWNCGKPSSPDNATERKSKPKTVTENRYAVKPPEGMFRVTAGVLSLRVAPDRSSTLVTALYQGQVVRKLADTGKSETIEGIEANWWQVVIEGRQGFVFSGFLAEAEDCSGIQPLFQKDPLRDAVCQNIFNHGECNAAVEKNRMENQSFVLRTGRELSIRMADGGTKVLSDVRQTDALDVAEIVHYHFREYFPQWDTILVSVSMWEYASEFLLWRQNGDLVHMARGIFVPAPDNRHAMILKFCDNRGAGGVQILRFGDKGPQIVFDDSRYCTLNGRWLDAGNIEIQSASVLVIGSVPIDGCYILKRRVRFSGDRWNGI